jgi:hypothetical protein
MDEATARPLAAAGLLAAAVPGGIMMVRVLAMTGALTRADDMLMFLWILLMPIFAAGAVMLIGATAAALVCAFLLLNDRGRLEHAGPPALVFAFLGAALLGMGTGATRFLGFVALAGGLLTLGAITAWAVHEFRDLGWRAFIQRHGIRR